MVDTFSPLVVNFPQPLQFVFPLCHVLEFARLERHLIFCLWTQMPGAFSKHCTYIYSFYPPDDLWNRYHYLLSSFFRWGNWGPERLRNWLKVTLLVSSRATVTPRQLGCRIWLVLTWLLPLHHNPLSNTAADPMWALVRPGLYLSQPFSVPASGIQWVPELEHKACSVKRQRLISIPLNGIQARRPNVCLVCVCFEHSAMPPQMLHR